MNMNRAAFLSRSAALLLLTAGLALAGCDANGPGTFGGGGGGSSGGGTGPTVTLTLTPSQVTPSASFTINWTVSDPAATCSAANTASDVNWTGAVSAAGGSKASLAPATPNIYGYTLSCSNASGTGIAQAELFDGVSPPVAADCMIKNAAGNAVPSTALLTPAATTSTSTSATCVACSVSQPDNVTDQNPNNYAVLNNTVGVLTGTVSLTVKNSSSFPGGRLAGFVLADSSSDLLTLVLLQTLSVDTLLGGQQQETASATPNGGPVPGTLQLSLLGTAGSPNKVFVGFKTTKNFDSLRVNDGGLLSAQGALNAYLACVSLN